MPWDKVFEVLKVVGPIAGNWLMNRGPSQTQDAALNEQMEIARRQVALQEQLAALDLPFRQNLLQALQSRMGQRMPRFMSPEFRQFNPYAHLRRVAPTQTAATNPNLFNAMAPVKQAANTTVSLPQALRAPAKIPLPNTAGG